jgi:hypothetical protein
MRRGGQGGRSKESFLAGRAFNRNFQTLLPATHWGQRWGHSLDGIERLKDSHKVIMTELSPDGGVDDCLPPSNDYFDQSQYQMPP